MVLDPADQKYKPWYRETNEGMEQTRKTAVIGMLLNIAARPHHKVLCIHQVELVLHADNHVHDF